LNLPKLRGASSGRRLWRGGGRDDEVTTDRR
jgi:hypothetical protein